MRTRSESTRKGILATAKKLFLKQGYGTTTMDEIAAGAGVSKQTLYGYFADKRALFVAVIKQAVGTPWAVEETSVEVKTSEALRDVLYGIAQRINAVSLRPSYIKLLRVIVSENNNQPELGSLFRKSVTYQSLQSLTKLLTVAKDSGVTTTNPTLAAQFFLGGFVIRIFLEGLLAQSQAIKRQSDEELRIYVDEFIRYIVNK